MSNYSFVPYEFPKSSDGRYILAQEDYQVLMSRREQLGLTQQEVADRSGILLRQYQRIESGEKELFRCSMKVGMSICAVLLLDPYDFIGINDICQPDPKTMKPQQAFDAQIPDEVSGPRKVGRKPIRRNVMKVYLNHPNYNLLIPPAVFEALGKPDYFQCGTLPVNHQLIIVPASADTEEAIDVPSNTYDSDALCVPGHQITDPLQRELGWDSELRMADAFLVHDNEGNPAVIVDTEDAVVTDPVKATLACPACYDEDD